VGTHGRHPFQSRKNFCVLAVLGFIDHFAFLFQLPHALLRERRPDDVTRQIFHSRFIFWRNTIAVEDIESGMFPSGQHPEHLFCNLAFLEEHLEYLMTEYGLQFFQFQGWRDTEYSFVAIKTAIRKKYVAVGIEAEEVTERLYGNQRAGDGSLFRHGLLHKNFQGFPSAAAEGGKQLPIVKKITAEDFRNGENEVPMRYFF